MKLIIASDLHGSAKYCQLLLQAFNDENADFLLLLGDVLYHGPRNPLPDEYNPQRCCELLAQIKDKIVCVRGNCDAEVDQMVLPFNVSADYAVFCADGHTFHLSHGHRTPPAMAQGDVYLTGHTHVPLNTVENGVYHLNPGSLSLPKEDSQNGFILYENGSFYFTTFDGAVYDALKIENI